MHFLGHCGGHYAERQQPYLMRTNKASICFSSYPSACSSLTLFCFTTVFPEVMHQTSGHPRTFTCFLTFGNRYYQGQKINNANLNLHQIMSKEQYSIVFIYFITVLNLEKTLHCTFMKLFQTIHNVRHWFDEV